MNNLPDKFNHFSLIRKYMDQNIVLIGDLIGSKELGDVERDRYQTILFEEINRINNKSTSIISPLTITLGDEFQAEFIPSVPDLRLIRLKEYCRWFPW